MSGRRVCLILNPHAGSCTPDIGEGARARGWAVREPSSAEEARAFAREEAPRVDRLIAGGGDGTVHQVLAGLLEAGEGAGALGVLPCGTGNDFARSLGLPLEPEAALAALDDAEIRTLDLGEVSVDGGAPRPFANHLHVGYAHRVDDEADEEAKARWGPLAYVGAALSVADEAFDPEAGAAVGVAADGEAPVEESGLVALVVANGRTLGGGNHVAPTADLEDGLLDLTLVRAGSLVGLAPLAVLARQGRTLESDRVEHRVVTRVALEVPASMGITVDGEPVAARRLAVRVRPGALRALVGPLYRRDSLPPG